VTVKSRLLPAFSFSNNVTDLDKIMSRGAYVKTRLPSLVVSRLAPKHTFYKIDCNGEAVSACLIENYALPACW
jgi:hypothetical protein